MQPGQRRAQVKRPGRIVVAVASGLALTAPRQAKASGFLLYEQSAEALGKAGAVTASTREPAAVWFNPAALSFMPDRGISVMAAYARSGTHFSSASDAPGADSHPGNHVVPNFFAHARLADRVQAGVGLYAPFGLTIHWPDGWAGAEKSLSTSIRFLALNPTIAVRVHDKLAFGVGGSLVRGDVAFATALPASAGGRVDLHGGGWGRGANLAVLYRPWPDHFHVAATYRTRAKIPLAGHADFSPQNPGGFEGTYADQAVASSITLPDVVTAGIMVRLRPALDLSIDVDRVTWTTFNRLFINFEKGSTPDIIIDRQSRNAFSGRAGVSWRLPSANASCAWVARAGVVLSQNTSQSGSQVPSTPDGNRAGFGLGLGYQRGRFTVDAGYMLLQLLEARSTQVPVGSYRSLVQGLALTFTVH